MLDRESLVERAQGVWREIRDDEQPFIAPYPEKGQRRPWKWDRPLDRAIGRMMARPSSRKNSLLERASAIVDGFDDLTDLGEAAFILRCRTMRTKLTRHGLRDDLVDECFALIREATGRALGMRHYPVQLMGGLIMVDGGIAEMATGEGKTITALLPAITAVLAGMPTHVFTVNDYLAERDLEKLQPVYAIFGLTTGLIIEGKEPDERREAYLADVVYGTNKEIAFDYLKDQAALGKQRGAPRRRLAELFGRASAPLTMRGLHFAVVDEADSIFIDEARTPLILSAEIPSDDDGLYLSALELASHLEEGRHYKIKAAERSAELTTRGKATVAELASGLPHKLWRIRQAREQLASQALSATHLFHKDRDYVVVDDSVQIVDEGTGRTMADRSWEGGLHQMVEVKEQVELTGMRNTLARITYQRFFRRYRCLSGMSGTVREVAGELWADYSLRVRSVPTNAPNIRAHRGHMMVETQDDKWAAVASRVAEIKADEGDRPILVGTRSVADSERVAAALEARGIAFRLLNARQDSEEAEIVAVAGEIGAVTVATNMAGRGTDIGLSDDARTAGGLYVIVTSFHETARVDRQLYGRAGRQGDPGSTQAITALDDELYALFGKGAGKMLDRSAHQWPIFDGKAEWLRRWAQANAERRHAAIRRQTELSEDSLRERMAFSGAE